MVFLKKEIKGRYYNCSMLNKDTVHFPYEIWLVTCHNMFLNTHFDMDREPFLSFYNSKYVKNVCTEESENSL